MNANNKEYIFLSSSAITGGIETLMVRMANTIAARGSSVSIVSPPGPLTKAYSPFVNHFEMHPTHFAIHAAAFFQPQAASTQASIWCSHPHLLRHAYRLQKSLYNRFEITSNSISGIFHPDQIEFHGKARRYADLLLLSLLPPQSVYFMNDAVKQVFCARYGAKFARWAVQKLAINESTVRWSSHGQRPLSIVSVGRITPFKAYNFGAPSIVKRLRERGIDCTWHIWGEGDALSEAEERAKNNPHVLFHGELPYADFLAEVVKHDVFVGMGTAALEAASAGMPTIVALIDSELESYGFLFACPEDSIGELIDGVSTVTVESLLYEYSSLPDGEKTDLGAACKAAVSDRAQPNYAEVESELSKGIQYPPPPSTATRMALIESLSRLSRSKALLARASASS